MIGLFFSLRMAKSKCSGPTELLARRVASSLLKARISDTFGEN